MKKLITIIITGLLFSGQYVYAEDHNSGKPHTRSDDTGNADIKGEKHGDHNEGKGVVIITAMQMKTAGIKVTSLMPAQVTSSIAAPGEVKLNAYRTIKITPRIAAQVIKRHARLGDLVKKGQPLVTLSSVEMASAQGRLLVADREWQRVRKLGRKVLSGRRYTEAKVARSLALSKVKAYGMSQPQIDRLLKDSNTMLSDGTFQLLSTLNARVLHDDFIVGERVDAGKVLMIISDESVMWVEARITADQMKLIKIGNLARVRAGNKNLSATVSQLHHTLDEITRTLAIRMEVKNPGDILHPGMFVKVIIQTSDKITAFVLPESAVLRSQDGDWQILVEQDEPGEFKPVEVKLLRFSNGKAVIEGIKPGTRVVTQGAFFVQSELAKAGFKIHNH